MQRQAESMLAEPPVSAVPSRRIRETLWLAQRQLGSGDAQQAELILHQLVHDEPRCAEAWFFLGVIRQRDREAAAAIRHFEHAIQLAPDLAEAHNNLGVLLQEQRGIDRAEACFREALRLMPDYPEAWNNLGNALQDQGRYEEAVESYHQALKFRPGYLDAIKHLGNALRALGRTDEAIQWLDEGLRLAPEHILLHMSRAMVWIQQGDYARGWAECEWRLRGKDSPVPAFSRPMWDGTPLDGRTILVYAEQGLGDTIQFLRYVPLIASRGGQVVLACAPQIARIAATCPGVSRVFSAGSEIPEFDCFVPLLSLPRIFGTSLETIPLSIPYLANEPDLVDLWDQELRPVSGLRIGVVWQGNPIHTKDYERSFPLRMIEPVARIPGVTLFSLQKNFGLEQLPACLERFPLVDLGPRLNDFADTAAVMKNLDLVISADSSPAHLGGALGVPVWVALPLTADWRWMAGREDSPWYPSLRLFRQHAYGDWASVFEDMARAVRRLIETPR